MLKNNGVSGNVLSNLDPGGVLKDSHNLDLHALDVNVVSGLVPSSFSKVVPTVDAYGRITNLKYYGLGLNEIIKLVIPSNAQGLTEISTFSFNGLTPENIEGKYVVIYDSIGKVIPWFNKDSMNPEPSVVGTTRYIEIPISAGDSSLTLTSKFTSVMNSDLEFSAQSLSNTSIVQNVTLGPRTDSNSGNSGILVSVGQQGIESLAGKLFYLWKYDNSDKYAFYFTIDSIGSEPIYSGISITKIELLSTDTLSQIATKTATKIATIPYFSSSATDSGQLSVSYRTAGDTSGFLDSNTGINSEVVQNGSDLKLVQEIIITYPEVCGPPIIEALL